MSREPQSETGINYQNILDHLTESIIIIDRSGTILCINAKAKEQIYRDTKKSCSAGDSIFDYIIESRKIFFSETIEKACKEEAVEYDHEYISESNENIYFHYSINPVYEEGVISCISITGRDITESKISANKLLKTEKDYQYLFQKNPFPLFIYNLESNAILEANEAAISLYGYNHDEFLSLTLEQIGSQQNIVSFEERLSKINVDTGFSEGSLEHIKKNGDTIYVEISALHFEFQGTQARLVLIHDITQKKLAEDSFNQLEHTYQNLLNSVNGIVWQADANTFEFTFISKAVERILGYTPEQWLASPTFWEDHILPEDRKEALSFCRQSVSRKESHQFEYRMIAADGSLIYINDIVSVILENDKPVILRGIMSDITVRKEAELKNEFRARLLNTIGQAVIATNIDCRINYWNKAAEEIYGWTEKEALGQDVVELLFAPQHTAHAKEIMQQLLRRCSWSGEQVVKKKNGDELEIFVTNSPFYDQNNKMLGIIGVSNDITEKKKTEEKIIQSEERLRIALAVAKVGSWETDLSTLNIIWSEETYHIFEIDPQDSVASHFGFLQYVHPDDRENVKKAFDESLQKDSDNSIEHRIITAKGNEKVVEERWHILKDNEGKPVRANGTVQDITEGKKAEFALQQSEARFKGIISTQTNYILRTDFNGNYTYYNQKFFDDFGWVHNQEDLTGSNSKSTIMEYHHQRVEETVAKCFANLNQVFQVEIDKPARDGAVKTTLWDFICLTDVFGNPTEIQCVGIDITERKQAETQLNELNENLQIQAKKLEASNEELERYAYVASHDLQEPLRMVTGFLQLLKKKYDPVFDATAQKYINFAVDGAERMRTLILDLLKFSRISSLAEDYSLIDLNKVVKETKESLKLIIEESDATINVSDLPMVWGNESQLMQLFQNLITNAIRYGGHLKPEIVIRCTEGNGEWQFFVQDNGIGIEPKFFEKIFIIFQRLHNRNDFKGTGIGLAICKKIVELHGGNIWVESEKGKGSTFYFTILKSQVSKDNDTHKFSEYN